MKSDELIAIDLHVYAEISCCQAAAWVGAGK